MPKVHLNISLENDVYEIAKNMNINLSNEFERWIKIRLGQREETKEEDLTLEIAKHKEAIATIEAKSIEQNRMKELNAKEDLMIEQIVNNMINDKNEDSLWKDIINLRALGLQTIWARRFNKRLTTPQACDLITNKLIEKGIDLNEA